MIKPRLFLCGGIDLDNDDPLRDGRHMVQLATHGPHANVNVRLEDVARVFGQHLSPRLEDLLEIAAYVYTADCATRRSGAWADGDSTEPWPRDFSFIIPVRDLDFWNSGGIASKLAYLLNLLSDDSYEFIFRPLTHDIPKQAYFEYGDDEDWPFYNVDRVIMFSGGLDSLAGAVESAYNGKNLVLVSHRPVSKQSKRQSDLFMALRDKYDVPMIHVPVWINKEENKGREPSQRTRSFLYSALGAIVADSVRASGVSFFENGTVSLNFPVADEVLQARASRTTHPMSLMRFSDLYSQILGRELVVDNPFVYLTKTEVVAIIGECGGSELIGLTCSCAHQGLFQSKTQWHCGTCSQCIDRRIAVFAAELQQYDPSSDYKSDVFTGVRESVYERNMAVNYARHGLELNRMGEEEMAAQFNRDLTRAVRPFDKRSETAKRFIEMHIRHGRTVEKVLVEQLQQHGSELLNGTLDDTSMLAMIAGQKHRESAWRSFADRITCLLSNGVPAACKSNKPDNEPHLQEICDGIIRGNNEDLIREFPFMRWGSVGTKPDWSSEEFCLWVELKYIRKKENIRPITEDIAADITKYGDNNRRVLYIVYDPYHLVTDETSLSEPVEKRPAMQIRFIR